MIDVAEQTVVQTDMYLWYTNSPQSYLAGKAREKYCQHAEISIYGSE